MAVRHIYVYTGGDNSDPDGGWATAINSAAEFEKYLEGSHAVHNIAAHDIVYVRSSLTVNAAWDSSGTDGTATTPIAIIGVKAATTNAPPVIGDWASGDDRPLLTCAAYAVTFGDYYKIFNLRFTGTATTVVTTGTNSVIYNCDSKQNSSTANRTAISLTGYTRAISCQASGGPDYVTGVGFAFATGSIAIFCRADDLNTGYNCGSNTPTLLFCIAEDCAVAGVSSSTRSGQLIMNCTFNDCAVGVSASTGWGTFINNLLEGCTADGFLWTTQTDCNFFAYNHGDDTRNNDMWDGVETSVVAHKDNGVTTGDPVFTADENLSLQSTSPCIDAGLALTLGVG